MTDEKEERTLVEGLLFFCLFTGALSLRYCGRPRICALAVAEYVLTVNASVVPGFPVLCRRKMRLSRYCGPFLLLVFCFFSDCMRAVMEDMCKKLNKINNDVYIIKKK